ncbi:MAG: gluconolaconase, partial [Sphingobacteriales bacterium]
MKTLKLIAVLAVCLTGCIAIKPSERNQFDAPDSYPEGVTFDKVRQVYYVSSARNGAVGKVTPGGQYTVLYADSSLKSSYGMHLHPDGRRLFVCVSDANYSRLSTAETKKKMIRLISIDVMTGKKEDDIDLSKLVPGKHFGNDLTFDDKGNIYITDSYANVIYRVGADKKASVFANSEKFKTEGVGLNGIVYHPGGFLLTASSNKGQIYKVNINNPAQVEKVMTDQYFMGGDGLLLDDSSQLVIVVNGGTDKIFRLASDDNWKSAYLTGTTLAADRFTYPSTATMNGKDVWVMNAR